MGLKQAWQEKAFTAWFRAIQKHRGRQGAAVRCAIEAVAPLIAAEARSQALKEAEHIIRSEEYEPPQHRGRYIYWPGVWNERCAETSELVQATGHLANSVAALDGRGPRDLAAELKAARDAELASVKAAIERQPESTKANLAGKFKMGSEG